MGPDSDLGYLDFDELVWQSRQSRGTEESQDTTKYSAVGDAGRATGRVSLRIALRVNTLVAFIGAETVHTGAIENRT